MKRPRTVTILGAVVAMAAAALALALAAGGPAPPPAMASINNPFRAVDFSTLPPLEHFTAGDGLALAYRHYRPQGGHLRGSVVLVHGSSASSNSMHVLAGALAAAGYGAYALDMRGHGASGARGHIAYVGQLEDDIGRFMRAVSPPAPVTLAGFSAGGGFVLRVVGAAAPSGFQSCLLLSPFLGADAPNYRPHAGGWLNVGVPRYVALSMLNAAGISALNDLTVVRFGLSDEARRLLTPAYSFNLASNFRPLADYAANIRAVQRPCAVVAGADDEAFDTARIEGLLRGLGKDWPVTLLPHTGHVDLIVGPGAVQVAVDAVSRLQAAPAPAQVARRP